MDKTTVDETWNKRSYEFDGEKITKILWKDAKVEKWCCYSSKLGVLLKSMNKLSITSQLTIIERIIYKQKNQMRRDTPFQYFKKVKKMVQRYTNMNMIENILNLQRILTEIKVNSKNVLSHIDVPHVHLIVYIMDRMLGASKLIIMILVSCQDAFVYLDSHMRHGFFVSFNLFAIASVSRLWMVFKEALDLYKLAYLVLLEILNEHPNNNARQYSYPNSLDDWLIQDLRNVLPQKNLERKNKPERILSNLNTDSKSSINELVSIPVEDLGESLSLDDPLMVDRLRSKVDFKMSDTSIANVITPKTTYSYDRNGIMKTPELKVFAMNANNTSCDTSPLRTPHNLNPNPNAVISDNVADSSPIVNAGKRSDSLLETNENNINYKAIPNQNFPCVKKILKPPKKFQCPVCCSFIRTKSYSIGKKFSLVSCKMRNSLALGHTFYLKKRKVYRKLRVTITMNSKEMKRLSYCKQLRRVKHALLHTTSYKESRLLLLRLKQLMKTKQKCKKQIT